MSSTTHLITADELIRMPDDGRRYELFKGELLTMSPAGEEHAAITMRLSGLLEPYVRSNRLGRAYAEGGFKLESNPDTVLAPDIAFIRLERVGTVSKSYRAGAPDLAVEVLSPNDRTAKIEEKTARWLSLGVSVVWLVSPQNKTVEICFANGKREKLTESDELTGGDLIPGFRILVSDIFAD